LSCPIAILAGEAVDGGPVDLDRAAAERAACLEVGVGGYPLRLILRRFPLQVAEDLRLLTRI